MIERVPLRGGNWNNGSNAGLGALNLNNVRSNSNTNIGFRPAYDLSQWSGAKGLGECTEQKELYSCLRTNTATLPAASRRLAPEVAGSFFIMPRTHKNLWESIVSLDNLYHGYAEARKGKRYTIQATKFAANLEENIIDLHNELAWKVWEPEPLRQFVVREPKERTISAPAFRDRVVHHALVRVIEPLFERRFIDHSYACRVGKGNHGAVAHVQNVVRRAPGSVYFLQGDVRSYFASINHDVLKAVYRRVIADRNALWLTDTIIDSFYPGLPIGALTSQLGANVYLDQLDHYVVDDLGWGAAYTRYMDDFVIVSTDRPALRAAEANIAEYLRTHLALELNHKTRVVQAGRGIDFCGYRIFPHHLLPRKRNVKRARRRLRALARQATRTGVIKTFRDSLMSFLGYMKSCRGSRTTKSILRKATIGGGK